MRLVSAPPHEVIGHRAPAGKRREQAVHRALQHRRVIADLRRLAERLVDNGQAVKNGQPLMRIDPADLRLAARAHEEAVAAATARARQTADDEARYRGLVSAGAVSRSAYDQVKAAAELARAELNAAKARAQAPCAFCGNVFAEQKITPA